MRNINVNLTQKSWGNTWHLLKYVRIRFIRLLNYISLLICDLFVKQNIIVLKEILSMKTPHRKATAHPILVQSTRKPVSIVHLSASTALAQQSKTAPHAKMDLF